SLPDPEQPLPPQIEASMSRFIAEAAAKVLQDSQATAAQQKAQEEAQDPIIQLRKLELQLKAQEMKMEHAVDQEKIELEREIAQLKAKVELARIAAKGQEVGYTKTLETAVKKADRESRERTAEKQAAARNKAPKK